MVQAEKFLGVRIAKVVVGLSVAIAPGSAVCSPNQNSTSIATISEPKASLSEPKASISQQSKVDRAEADRGAKVVEKSRRDSQQQEAIRQTVLADPLIKAALQAEINRVPNSARPVVPLQVGAIAIVNNYALAEWFAGVGDLPFDGYALLIQQQSDGPWIVLTESVGLVPGSITPNLLTRLGLPQTLVTALVNEFRAAGAKFEVDDTGIGEEPMICITQVQDPNPPTHVRLLPEITPTNILGQLPQGTPITVVTSLQGWLKIRQPLIGWVSLNLTQVSCGNSPAEVQARLNQLSFLEEELAVKAADTLVRYLYRGVDASYVPLAVATFDKLASNIRRFDVLQDALDRQTEDVRQKVLQQVLQVGLSPTAQANFAAAVQRQRQGIGGRSPTLETWQRLSPTRSR
ncbi:MAG: hypothetical protein NZ772_07430 [Cyanobacteria bacterium]|nr:hypothetical protein [Cyanobacteriota bacterium]MDW8201011.1 hypothetical protein [Cyanobacteriota bacterium SKYGB_h_bin112]